MSDHVGKEGWIVIGLIEGVSVEGREVRMRGSWVLREGSLRGCGLEGLSGVNSGARDLGLLGGYWHVRHVVIRLVRVLMACHINLVRLRFQTVLVHMYHSVRFILRVC